MTRRPLPAGGDGTRSRSEWLISIGLLVAAIALVYGNSLPAPFHFDDFEAIVDNAQIRKAWPFDEETSTVAQVAGRPIVNLSYALNYPFAHLDAAGYRLVNIGIHILCALLIYGVVRSTLRTGRVPASWRDRAHGLALAIALVWAVHPIHTGTVTYISARSESLMAVWYLTTLYASIHAHDGVRRRAWAIIAIMSSALGMATKETMVTAPLMVFLHDRAFFFGSSAEAFAARWRLYTGLAATMGILVFLSWSAPRAESAGFGVGVSAWTYMLNQAVVVTDYFRVAVWPDHLVFTYGEPLQLTLSDVMPYAAFMLVLVTATVWAWRRRPDAAFPAVWFFLILTPTSTVISIATEVGAERRMYLPLAGLVALVVVGGCAAAEHVQSSLARLHGSGPTARRWVPPAVVAIVCLVLAASTIRRNTAYLSAEALWRSTLASWPSGMAHRNLATALKVAGKPEEALTHFLLTVDGHPEMRSIVGEELFELRRYDDAIRELQTFITTASAGVAQRDARVLLGRAFLAKGMVNEASDQFEAIVRRYPTDAVAQLALADARLAQRQFDAAAGAYRSYLQTQPNDPGALINFGIALLSLDAPAEAANAFRRAIAVEPRNALALRNLAVALAASGETEEATAQAAAAVGLAPGDAVAHALYGRLLLSGRRTAEAREQFERALQIDPSMEEARNALTELRDRR